MPAKKYNFLLNIADRGITGSDIAAPPRCVFTPPH